MKKLEIMPHEDQLTELVMFSVEKRLGRNIIAVFKYLQVCHVEKGLDLFCMTPASGTRNNGQSSKEANMV